MQTKEDAYITIQLYLQKQEMDDIWLVHCFSTFE